MTEDLTALKAISQHEVERQFAAISLLYPLYTIRECAWLESALFTDSVIHRYWRLFKDRVNTEMTDDEADSVALQCALESDAIGEINEWARRLPPTPMPQAYANELGRRAYLTHVSARMGELWKAISNNDDAKVIEINRELSEGYQINAPAVTAPDIHERFVKIIREGNRSLHTHIPNLDIGTGGLEKQCLTILAGRPGMGKTALGLQIGRNIADSGRRVDIFSLEMSDISLWARMACPLAGVSWRDFLAGKLNADNYQELDHESEKLSRRYSDTLYIHDGPHKIEDIWRTAAAGNSEAIIIDHLRLIKDRQQGENENKRQGRISELLHDLSKAFDIPVLCLVQLNRSVEQTGDKRPQLSDLRDSGEIEENADNVWMLYREGYYNPPTDKSTIQETELWIRKFRNGPAGGVVRLYFDMASEWFEPKGRV